MTNNITKNQDLFSQYNLLSNKYLIYKPEHRLPYFIADVFKILNPSTEYSNNWHISLISEYLNAVQHGHIKRLIINLPPRSLKSIIVSVAWPAWILGLDPSKRIIAASYTQSLSTKHSLDTKIIMESELYCQNFSKTKLIRTTQKKLITSKNGFRYATSIGGSITGEGGDYLIIDDPHNPTYVNSKKMRHKVIDWYENTFATRLNNPKKGAIVLVMQRLCIGDLTDYLKKQGSSWTVLSIPIQSDKKYTYVTFNHHYKYNKNDILDKTRYDLNVLNQIKQSIGLHNFNAQYLQKPNLSRQILSNDMILQIDNMPTKYEFIVQSWDTASQTSNNADFSVCATFGVYKKKYYLINLFKARVQYTELKTNALKLIQEYKPMYVLIENKSSGQALIQELKILHDNIIPQTPKIDKLMRLETNINIIQSGTLVFPKNSTWINDVILELTEFPNGKHDDIVDCITQFLSFIKYRINIQMPRIRSL